MTERSNIRSLSFLETKLKFERHKSEDTLRKYKTEAKALRHKTIELESSYYAIVEALEDKINQQNEEIQSYQQK